MTQMNELVVRLGVLYGRPDSTDPKAFVAEYARALERFVPSELKAAGDLIVETREYKTTWPSVPEVVRACETVRATARVKAMPPRKSEHDAYPEWSEERKKLANTLIQCDMGRQAATEGWIGALWDFCRANQRRPHFGEIPKIRAVALDFDKAFCDCSDGDLVLGAALIKLGKSILARREELAQIANGEVQ